MESLQDILDRTRAFLQAKEAEFRKSSADSSSDITQRHATDITEGVDNVTSDKMIDVQEQETEITKKNKKQKYNSGDVLDKNLTDISEGPSMDIKEKDMITDDDKAAAARLSNDILAAIRQYQKSAATINKKNEASDTEKEESDKPDVEGRQDINENTDEKNKSATAVELELTTDILAKIAALILTTEEGVEFVEKTMAKAAGEEAALETLSFLAEQAELAEKAAAAEAGAQDAERIIQQLVSENNVINNAALAKAAGANDAEVLIQNLLAQAAVEKQAEEADFYTKLGQAVADSSIEDLLTLADASTLAQNNVGSVNAETSDEDDITIEEVVNAIDALVQDGTLKPEEAQQILEALVTSFDGAGSADKVENEETTEAVSAGEKKEKAKTSTLDKATPSVSEKQSSAINSLISEIKKIKNKAS